MVAVPPVLRASELYALSQDAYCSGDQQCHWCGGSCTRLWLHDDPPPIPFMKNPRLAACPSNPYICIGCWLFRRKRISVSFLDGSQRDGQAPVSHSWWITKDKAVAIRCGDYPALYPLILKPPKKFALNLLDRPNMPNRIHLAAANDCPEVKADTVLHFTIDNTPYSYTVYEMEEAGKTGSSGRSPGVRELIRLLGKPPAPANGEEDKRGVGRPKTDHTREKDYRRIIRNR